MQNLIFCVYNVVQKSPNAVYLRVNCQLHSGFSYDKKSMVSVSDETKIFQNKYFLVFAFMGKMLIIQFHSMEKMPIIIFHSMEKMLIMLFFIVFFVVYEIV